MRLAADGAYEEKQYFYEQITYIHGNTYKCPYKETLGADEIYQDPDEALTKHTSW